MVRYKICRLLEHRSVGLSQVINAQPHSCLPVPEYKSAGYIYKSVKEKYERPTLGATKRTTQESATPDAAAHSFVCDSPILITFTENLRRTG